MIDTENFTKTYHHGKVQVPALKGMSIRIECGELVGIMSTGGSV